MYESFFGFTTRPFVAAPVVENYFPATSIEQAHQTLVRIVDLARPVLCLGWFQKVPRVVVFNDMGIRVDQHHVSSPIQFGHNGSARGERAPGIDRRYLRPKR